MSILKVKILSHTQNPEEVIATAAKLCYSPLNIEEIQEGLTSEEIERFTGMLATLGHESPFEHVSYTFAIEGVSRALTHQLVRHRLASYSQQSQRYVSMADVEFIKPDLIAGDDMASDIFDVLSEVIAEKYEEIKTSLIYNQAKKHVEDFMYPRARTREVFNDWFKGQYPKEYSKFEKIANENARSILPNACETKIVVTMNVRSLFNFFKHRCCDRAQTEIRTLAREMLRQVKQVSPSLFKKAGSACISGICPEGAMQCDRLKGKIPTAKDVRLLIKEHYNIKEEKA